MNIEDYSIGFTPKEYYRGAIVVLSVLLGAIPFEDSNNNKEPWYNRFKK